MDLREGPGAQVLSCERVYSGKLLEIDIEKLRLPNGADTELEIIRHPGAAAVAPIRPDGTVVMIRQYRRAAGGWILEIPAGKLDPGETPDTCAHRELREEVGLRADNLLSLGPIHTTPGFTDELIWLYAATGLSAVPQELEDDEVIEVIEMPLAEALDRIAQGEVTDSKTICALLRVDQEQREGRISFT